MKTTKEMIKVMQSWNGQWGADCNIQFKTKFCDWQGFSPNKSPAWNWDDCDYRVDPKTMTPNEKVEHAWNGLSGEDCNIEYQMKTADARKSHWRRYTEGESPRWNWQDFHYRVKTRKPWLFGKKEKQ